MIWALHGNFGHPSDWDGLEEACGLPVQALDLYAARQPAESVGGWLREITADDAEPLLLGYSLGGRLALRALAEDPSAWTAAIIVSAHPGLADSASREVREISDAGWAARLAKGECGWEEFLRAWDAQPVLSNRTAPGDGQRLWREGLELGFEEWSLGKQPDLMPMLGGVNIPVLWVTGEEDEKFTREAKRACAVMPDAEHVVIEGVGHRVPWEARDMFAAVVQTFAEKSGLL